MNNVGAMFKTGTSVADTGRTTERERDPLALSPSRLKALGYSTIDLLVDQLTNPDVVAMRRASAEELSERLGARIAAGAAVHAIDEATPAYGRLPTLVR
jgi:hypothetical protein